MHAVVKEKAEVMGSIQNRLGDVLAEKQWTLMDLAEMTNLSYASLRRIMRRKCNPPLDVAMILSRTLEVPLEHLFSLGMPSRRKVRSRG